MLYESIQNFPVDIGMTDAVLRAVNVIGSQDNPFALSREIQVFPGARWELEISLLPNERADAQRLEAWLLSLRGTAGRFRFADPFRSLPLGTPAGVPVVVSATAGNETFTTSGWAVEHTGLLKAGDFIQLGTRLHMVLLDVSSDGSGNATVTVWPPLRESHAGGTSVITSNARGIFTLASPTQDFTRDRYQFNTTTLKAVEFI